MSETDTPDIPSPPPEAWTMELMTECAQRLLEGHPVEEVQRATGVSQLQLESIRRQLIKSGLALAEGPTSLRRSGVFVERVEQLIRSSGGFLRRAFHLAEDAPAQAEGPAGPSQQGSPQGRPSV